MTDWRIEPLFSPSDIDRVLAIEREAFPEGEFEDRQVTYLWVARDNTNTVIAFAAFKLSGAPREAHIETLVVVPERSGEGIGSAVLGAVVQAASRMGAQCATLQVAESNEPARRLYEQAGFQMAGVRQQSSHKGTTMLIFRISLREEGSEGEQR